MNTESIQPTSDSTADTDASTATHPVRTPSILPKRTNRAAAVAGTILVGGGALVALLGPLSASAASPSPDPSAAAGSAATAPAAQAPTATPDTTEAAEPAGPGGHVEAASDTSVAAKAIGITEADLLTALQSGKTIAAVATANNVAPQKVIDALTQDGLDELAAQVTAGTLTQAQADAEKANVTQRATDQVNGTFKGGDHGHNEAGEAPEASPATSGG
jgi:hypothetical protein